MAGTLDFYNYDIEANGVISQKQQQANIDNTQDKKIKELEEGGETPKQSLIQTTYSELKSLRDNSQLIPGCWYRITDYECTTSQENTKSAGHKFDILVLATSVNTLSEEARAIQSERDKELQSIYSSSQSVNFIRYPEADGDFEGKHYYAFLDQDTHEDFIYTESLSIVPTEQNVFATTTSVNWEEDGDSFVPLDEAIVIITFAEHNETVTSYTGLYFSNCNLNAWKIWYCLDNDTSRFAWADTSNGKGVIYRMIDEWNNDCPYDFKNIQFSTPSTYPYGVGGKYVYTFTWYKSDEELICDATVETPGVDSSAGIKTVDNIVKSFYNVDGSQYYLNNIKLISCSSYDLTEFVSCYNTFNYNCRNITMFNNNWSNIFGDNCSDILLGDSNMNNVFKNYCRTIGLSQTNEDAFYVFYNCYFGDMLYNLTGTAGDMYENFHIMNNIANINLSESSDSRNMWCGYDSAANIRWWNPADAN